jgi:NAD(P)H-dependent flavin oxidoreductase YrpB (nitropropane dioxygenase family)
VFTTGAGNPTPYIAPMKAVGTLVIPVVASQPWPSG